MGEGATRGEEETHEWETLAAGASAGVAGTVIGYPFDAIKTRLQARGDVYSSMGSTLAKVLREEGVFGIYRGMAPTLLSLTVIHAIAWSMYDRNRRLLGLREGDFDWRVPASGAMAAPFCSIVSTPAELLKVQATMSQARTGHREGSLAVARRVVASSPTRFFSGHVVNMTREGIFLATYFTCYHAVREKLVERGSLPTAAAVPMAGGISGSLSWAVSFPLDCCKSRVQAQQLANFGTPSWVTARRAAADLLRQHGIRGLYTGMTSSVVRAFVVSSARFSAYEVGCLLAPLLCPACFSLTPPSLPAERSQGSHRWTLRRVMVVRSLLPSSVSARVAVSPSPLSLASLSLPREVATDMRDSGRGGIDARAHSLLLNCQGMAGIVPALYTRPHMMPTGFGSSTPCT